MGRVTLWHGTTLERAECIRADGFRPVDVESGLMEVAERHDVEIDHLRATLRDHSRYAVTQDVRSDLTWLAVSRAAPERWAARAPEIRWEALWAVWWLTRDTDDPTPWKTPKAAGWHAQQFFKLKPAIIEMEVPVRRVSGPGGEKLAPGEVRAEVRNHAPELSIRPPGEIDWIKGVHAARRPVDFTAVAGLLRVSTDDLVRAVKAGRVPEPRPGRTGMDWTWFEDELPSIVPAEMLATGI